MITMPITSPCASEPMRSSRPHPLGARADATTPGTSMLAVGVRSTRLGLGPRLWVAGGVAAALWVGGAWLAPAAVPLHLAVSPSTAGAGDRVVSVALVYRLPAGRLGLVPTAGGSDGAGSGGAGSDGAGSGGGTGVVSSPCGDGACGHGGSASSSTGSGGGDTGHAQSPAVREAADTGALHDTGGDSGGFAGWVKHLFGASSGSVAVADSDAHHSSKDDSSPEVGASQDGPLPQHTTNADSPATSGSTSKSGKSHSTTASGFGGNAGSGVSIPAASSGGIGHFVSGIVSRVFSGVSSVLAHLVPGGH